MRKRTHRVAADLERKAIAHQAPEPAVDPPAEIVVLTNGAHIRATRGCQSRDADVTVSKIEGTGKPPRRFALAPKGAQSPLAALRQALRDQGWQPGVGDVYALAPQHRAGLEMVEWRLWRLRHLIWNSYHETAHDGLFGMRRPAVARLLWNCDDLRRYLANNTGSLIDYGACYRSRLPISTSRAEGCVDEIAVLEWPRSSG